MKRSILIPPKEEGGKPTLQTIYVPRGKKRGRGTPGAFGGVTKSARAVRNAVAQALKAQELKEAHGLEIPPAQPPAAAS